MEYWLRMAKNLGYGQHDKIQCCATDRSMRIEHNATEYRGFCFRCKQNVREPIGQLSLAELSQRRVDLDQLLHSKSLNLPSDLSTEWTNDAAGWLLRAGIPLALAEKYGFGYSKKIDRVVLPVYRDKELVAYTMRSTKDKPKYIERQIDESVIFVSDDTTILEPEQIATYGLDFVVTEDILSAVRVGRIVSARALLGTAVGPSKVGGLLKDVRNVSSAKTSRDRDAVHGLRVGIWLDADKAGRVAARRLESRLELQGHSVLRIRTDKDPKRYSNREIRSILHGDRRYFTPTGEEPEGLRSTHTDALGEGS